MLFFLLILTKKRSLDDEAFLIKALAAHVRFDERDVKTES